MRSYMNLAVLALAASTFSLGLSAPIQYRYRKLLVVFKVQAFLISEISLGTLGRIILIILSISFVVFIRARTRTLPFDIYYPNPVLPPRALPFLTLLIQALPNPALPVRTLPFDVYYPNPVLPPRALPFLIPALLTPALPVRTLLIPTPLIPALPIRTLPLDLYFPIPVLPPLVTIYPLTLIATVPVCRPFIENW
jgi:hypothetical protein